MQIDTLLYWINERHQIFLKKEAGAPKPWTEDAILQRYRFCNPYRENDKVTRWITENWRAPHAEDPDLWFAMVVARHFNLPESLGDLGYPAPFNRDHMVAVMAERKAAKKLCYNGAYMIGTNGTAMEKTLYLADRVFQPLWNARETLRPKAGDTLTSYHFILGGFYGLASFLAGQVVCDLKYVSPLREASDWATFAASGPGSRRGLNRVLGYPVNAPWREDNWRMALSRLYEAVTPRVAEMGLPPLHAQDLQNTLCEYDKLMRVRQGEGKPKQLYPGLT